MPQVIRKVTCLPIRNRKVLFARSYGKTLFYNLGGKLKPGENNEEALRRELLEEACVTLSGIAFLNHFTGVPDGKADTTLEVDAYYAKFEGTPTPSSEIEELAEFTSKDGHRTTSMGQQILAWLVAQNLID